MNTRSKPRLKKLGRWPGLWARSRTPESAGLSVSAHTGVAVEPAACLLDESGHVYLVTPLGVGLVHTQDVGIAADAIERKIERQLITDYEAMVGELLDRLTRVNHPDAVAIARVPERIRGYGHVKLANVATARAQWAELLPQWRGKQDLTRREVRIPLVTEVSR